MRTAKRGMLVYVAGPYSNGDKLENTRNAMDVAEQILALGHYPFIPHLTHFFGTEKERPGVDSTKYLEWDLALLLRCDALIRIPGVSKGADQEVQTARAAGIPVYYMTGDVPLISHRQYIDLMTWGEA